jgi:galactose mutarotase-like enzyme
LEFSEIENANVWPLSKQGLVANESIPFFLQTNKLALTKELFYKDALVFKNLASNSICIQSNKSEHGLTVNFTGFSYMGIWSFKDADFVCIEPWCGIADNESTTQQLIEKEGMIALEKNKIFEASWHVTTF